MRKVQIKIIAVLALFNFIFLGSEYLFDNMMAYTTDASGVVIAQSQILGVSAVGFFLYSAMRKWAKRGIKYPAYFGIIVTCIICLFMVSQHISNEITLMFGCILFLLLGAACGAVHDTAAYILDGDGSLARTVGAAYAVGILLQFINNNFVNNEIIEPIVLSVSLTVGGVLLMGMGRNEPLERLQPGEKTGRRIEGRPGVVGGILIVNVVLMTCVFATLDNAVTLVHAAGQMDIGQWPGILLALSGLAAGFMFDWKKRRYMYIIMYCVTLLSTICVVVIEFGGPFLAGLIAFYLSAGFFVVFFSTGFMEISRYMKIPELWAGLGRITNNLCAVLIGSWSVALIESGNSMIISIVAIVLFAMISVTTFLYSGRFRDEAKEHTEKPEEGEECENEKFSDFCEKFSLTGREQDVLRLLLTSDDNMQELAEHLFISRAALYRHIASLNEKTETKSRIGLLQFYYAWNEKN